MPEQRSNAQALTDHETNDTNIPHETFVKETINKEAKLEVLANEKRNLEKEINHIKRSNTWRHSSKLRSLQKLFHKLTGRSKTYELSNDLFEMEAALLQTEKDLYETKEQLRNIQLNDRMLNSFQIIDFIRRVKDEGKLIDFLDQAIEEKKLHEDNYNEALTYIARLFMNEKIEHKHLIYSKILSALKIEDIPEFMLRAGLVEENSIPLKQVSSFRASLSMRLREKQLVGELPEFILENKLDAYHFIDYLNISKPEVMNHQFSIDDIPKKDYVVIKPIDGAGARGVYLVYDSNDIIDMNRSKQLNSWQDLKKSMQEDLESNRVSNDSWFMEELILENKEKKIPASDMKFYCFYGKVGVILEISRYPERKHCWWTATGDRIRTGKYEEDLFKSDGVTQEEIALAEELSLKIPAPFIRIDFLRSEHKLVFGEFTAKPGNYDDFDDATDQWLGDYYLDAQGRLVDDLLNGKSFEEFMKFKQSLGYSVNIPK